MTNKDNFNTEKYAVFGNPINHSKSPQIHSLFAQQTGQNISYTATEVPLNQFNQTVSDFAKAGGKGLNVTVPFKLDAWAITKQLSDRAKRAGAVNTLTINSIDDYTADNTDGIGLVRDLTINNAIEIKEKNILIIGAGGAVRGILQPLLEKQPASIFIANRTKEKATQLASEFGDLGNTQGLGLDELNLKDIDIIINGTSASLNNELPELPSQIVDENTFCYDMMYAKQPTVFMQWCTNNGAKKVSDGLGMLIEQAAESFYIWRGIKPETTPVIQSIRESL